MQRPAGLRDEQLGGAATAARGRSAGAGRRRPARGPGSGEGSTGTPARRAGPRSGAAAAARCLSRRTASRRRRPWSASSSAWRGCRGPRRQAQDLVGAGGGLVDHAPELAFRAGRRRGAPRALEARERDAAGVVVLLGAALQHDVATAAPGGHGIDGGSVKRSRNLRGVSTGGVGSVMPVRWRSPETR